MVRITGCGSRTRCSRLRMVWLRRSCWVRSSSRASRARWCWATTSSTAMVWARLCVARSRRPSPAGARACSAIMSTNTGTVWRGRVRRGQEGRVHRGEACEAEVALRGDRPVLLRRARGRVRQAGGAECAWRVGDHGFEPYVFGCGHAECAYVGSWLRVVGYGYDGFFVRGGGVRAYRAACAGSADRDRGGESPSRTVGSRATELMESADRYGKSPYGQHLKGIADGEIMLVPNQKN